jgi:hypothetical protein
MLPANSAITAAMGKIKDVNRMCMLLAEMSVEFSFRYFLYERAAHIRHLDCFFKGQDRRAR